MADNLSDILGNYENQSIEELGNSLLQNAYSGILAS